MPSIKDLKKRITTVKNTQQTTRALKMVSAAKLRRAQEAITAQRPYARKVLSMLQVLAGAPGAVEHSVLLKSVEAEGGKETAPSKLCLVLVTSDRGLCGSFNSSIIKTALRWIKANQANFSEVEMAFVGRRGYDFYKTRYPKIGQYYEALGGKVSFVKASDLTKDLQAKFLDGQFTEVKFIYNEFKNAVTQKVVVEDFLPIGTDFSIETIEKNVTGQAAAAPKPEVTEPEADYIFKPSAHELLDNLLSKSFAIQAHRILLESQASEHGARMSAMENATKNAGEMIKKLTLQYNKQRQAGITKELLEIIAGSESQAAQ